MTDRSFTFNQMADDCLRMANIWLEMGLQPQEIFGVCGDNSYEYIVCMLSGIFVGAIAVPIRGSDTMSKCIQFIDFKNIDLIKRKIFM